MANRRKALTASRFGSGFRHFFDRSAVLWGCVTAIIVVIAGRTFIEISVSTLPGWTALFLLALFLGLIVANASRNHAFASGLQKASFFLGAFTSLSALIFLEFQVDSAAEALLVIATILLMAGLTRMQWHRPLQDTSKDPRLAQWALRLDDLLKYEFPQHVRAQLIQLIDKLWQSPQDQADFIPVQNQQINNLLDELEFSARENTHYKIEETLSELLAQLEERNQLILKKIHIEYQDVSNKMPLLQNDSGANIRKQLK